MKITIVSVGLRQSFFFFYCYILILFERNIVFRCFVYLFIFYVILHV